MAITLKPSRDFRLIEQLERESFPGDEPYNVRSAKWWLAYHDGHLAGFAGAKVILGSRAVYLCRAGVKSGHRGHRIQLRLIRARVAWARRLPDIDCVITYTLRENTASSNNLIRAGFKLYRPMVDWSGPVLYWRLDI